MKKLSKYLQLIFDLLQKDFSQQFLLELKYAITIGFKEKNQPGLPKMTATEPSSGANF